MSTFLLTLVFIFSLLFSVTWTPSSTDIAFGAFLFVVEVVFFCGVSLFAESVRGDIKKVDMSPMPSLMWSESKDIANPSSSAEFACERTKVRSKIVQKFVFYVSNRHTGIVHDAVCKEVHISGS